ncbi:hypothetical protein H4R19_005399, partial [Coemansia spiralis]
MLPLLIVTRIVGYVCARSVEWIDGETRARLDDGQHLVPLLQASSLWRVAALSMLFGYCRVEIGDSVELTHSADKGVLRVPHGHHRHYVPYATSVSIGVSYGRVVDGSALVALERCGLGSLCLQRAFSLRTRIRIEGAAAVGAPRMAANACAFGRLLRRMMPNANRASIDIVDCGKEIGASSVGALEEHMGVVLRSVADGRQSIYVGLDSCLLQPVLQSCSRIENIARFSCRWNSSTYKTTAAIIHANAQSLLDLRITCDTLEHFGELVVSDRGAACTYSNLGILYLGGRVDGSLRRVPPLPGAEPFPRLAQLACRIPYPFSDDVVFRGNGSTLHHILVCADAKDVEFLARLGPFAGKRLKALKRLVVNGLFDETQDMSLATGALKALTRDVLPQLEGLFMFGEYVPSAMPLALFGDTQYRCMECLSL